MTDLFRLADDIGPAKILHLVEPAVGLRAVVVVDNVATGPSIGGVRMAPDVGVAECARLARAMTLKNAAAGLPHGGGKAVIVADPKMPRDRKEALIRAFARAIRDLRDYITGPDMGTDELCMAWVHDEIGRSVGLPRELGGIPLDEIGATGFGLAVAAEVAESAGVLQLAGARVAIQGFGAVGRHAARHLVERGAVLVAAADSRGTIQCDAGLDVARLAAVKAAGGSVTDVAEATVGDRDAIIDVPCDIWVPAARPDVLHRDNIDRLQTRLVLEGANIPLTREAEERLHERGVVVLPDFIGNAGGVICASVEYHGGSEAQAMAVIRESIERNAGIVLRQASEANAPPRRSAERLALERVRRAMSYRRRA